MSENNQDSIFRESMERALFKADAEKNKSDKLLNRDELVRVKQIMSKPILTAQDVNEVQNTLVANESKLGKFDGAERYLHHKFFIQVQNYAERYIKAIMADEVYQEERVRDPDFVDEETMTIRASMQKEYAVTYKKLINGFLFGVRSSLSEGGYMIEEINKEKKEYEYSGAIASIPQQQGAK